MSPSPRFPGSILQLSAHGARHGGSCAVAAAAGAGGVSVMEDALARGNAGQLVVHKLRDVSRTISAQQQQQVSSGEEW